MSQCVLEAGQKEQLGVRIFGQTFGDKQKNYAQFLKTLTRVFFNNFMSSNVVFLSTDSNDRSYFFVDKVFASKSDKT